MSSPFDRRSTPAALLRSLLLAFLAFATVHGAAAGLVPAGTELIPNDDFAAATKDPSWPDDWRRKPGISWENDHGVHYLHFVVDQPEKSSMLFQILSLPPADGVRALKVAVRYRTGDLKTGAKIGQDARMTFRFYDSNKIAFTPDSSPFVFADHAANWTTITTSLKVPANAVSLEFFIGLDEVESGTLDVAQVSMKNEPGAEVSTTNAGPGATDSAPSASSPADASVPIVRDGVHTILGYGKPSVWFIHPYVDVLGHNFVQGITNLILGLKAQGVSIAVGVAQALDPVSLQDEPDTIYVFTYKNINYPLPAAARRLIFVNTWLTPAVKWPASRSGKKDVVILGSRMLNNNGDGLATDKARWTQIQKDDPALTLTILDSAGYYLPIRAWREPILKIILEEESPRK